MVNVIERDTHADLESIHRALFEDEHLWCWCTDTLTVCGMYKVEEGTEVVLTDWEPSCEDCAKTTHCLYCGCELGFYDCKACRTNYKKWKRANAS